MESTVDIIEIIENHYILKSQNLCSALTSAQECDGIALISIIGPQNSGKTFFFECLRNYLNSDDRDKWLHNNNSTIKLPKKSCSDQNKKYTSIKLTSPPIILEEKIDNKVDRIAVFLMDFNIGSDQEMTPRITEDIMALFLTTSSTVIYNSKYKLQIKDLLKLQNSISRISSFDNSMNILQKVLFLIRDWNSENSVIKLGFGLANGKSYVKKLIEKEKLSVNTADINCYLMSVPGPDVHSETINLSEMMGHFKVDLKNVIPYKLLNTDEMEVKTKPNSDEPINANELIELFNTFVEELNNKMDIHLIEDLSCDMNALSIDTKSKEENESKESNISSDNKTDENISNDTKNDNKTGLRLEENTALPKYETQKQEIETVQKMNENNITEEKFENKSEDFKTIAVENHSHVSSDSNAEYFKSMDLKKYIDDDCDAKVVENELVSSENSVLDKNLENIFMSEDDNSISAADSCEESVNHNEDNDSIYSENENEYDLCEDANDANEPKDKQFITNVKSGNNSCSYIINMKNTDEIEEQKKSFSVKKILKNHLSPEEQSTQDYINSIIVQKPMTDSHVINMEKKDQNWTNFINEHLTGDKYFSAETHVNNFDDQNVGNNYSELNTKTSLIDESSVINEVLLKYNKRMESKLKDQNFDLEYGLSKVQKEIKNEIINEFEEYVKDMPSQDLAQKWKTKQNLRLIETKDQSVEEYQEKVKQKFNEARNEYQKVLKQMLKLYDIEMKDLIKAQLKTSLNENLDSFHNRSREKVERIFKEESVKFYKGNFEKEFLSKLNEEIIKSKNKYETIFSHLNNFKTEVKEKLRKENYISENNINKLQANAKQRINNSMKKLEDTDLIEIAVALLDKYFKFFKKCNEENERQEQQIAKNAIDLALTLYNNCFEAKLKTGLFLQKKINDIHHKLFDYTLNALKEACHFNNDQTYLIRRCEEDFKIKVVENYEHIITKYQEMFDRTTNLLTKAKTDALKKYCSEMCSRLSVKAYFKIDEFNDIHNECSKISFKTYDSLTEFIKKDFDTETANKIVVENHSEIRKNITTKKDYYKSLNDKKAPKTSTIAVYFGHRYISAATYDNKVDVVLDINNETLRFNSIAVKDKILYGSDAKDYYRKTYSTFPTFENFDIKQLIGRERKTISKEELNTYPFEFLNDKLSVFFNYNGFKVELSVESLLALMLMNIRKDGEKQFSKIMSNIVITIPTNYNLIQKNGIKNVAKVADFEDIHLITELSAAAIGYWADKLKNYYNDSKTVLFAVINGFDCDIAISTITQNKIQFVAHYHQNLNMIGKGSHYSFSKMLNWIGTKEKNLTLKNFEAMIEKTIKKGSFKKKDIDECVIAGDSQLIDDVKNYINLYFDLKIAYDCDPIDIIIKGSTIYSGMLSKKVPLIEVTEVTNFPISTILQLNYWNGKKEKVLETNMILPHVKCLNSFAPMRKDLPLKIHVYQDQKLVMTHLIETIPQLYRTQWKDFDYEFIFDNFGEITVQSFVSTNNYNLREKLDSTVIETGLTERQVNEERLKIIQLLNKIEEKNKLLNEESLVEQSKIKLINYFMEERMKFENNSELRSLIKRQILKEIDETLNYLKTKVLNLKDVKTQKQKLDNALEILLNK